METDSDFFNRRAEEEEAKAVESTDEAARQAHLRLAEIYRQSAARIEAAGLKIFVL